LKADRQLGFRSIRVQLIAVFAVSLLGAAAVSWLVYFVVAPLYRVTVTDYRPGMQAMDSTADQLALRLHGLRLEAQGAEVRRLLVEAGRQAGHVTAMVVDPSGKVLLADPTMPSDRIDPFDVIQTTSDLKADRTRYYPGDTYTAYAPVDMPDARAYAMIQGVPAAGERFVQKYSPAGGFAGVAAFFGLFFLLTRGKIRYLEELTDGLLVISRGRLDHRVPERGADELGSLARSVNSMAAELERNIQADRMAERTKHELIAGVSHDLRTPLTSIKGYLHLLASGKYGSPEQMAHYVRIAYAKTEQLQDLVEDLFEYARLSGGETRLEMQQVCLNELLEQMVEEYVPLSEHEQLYFRKVFSDVPLAARADPDRLARVFDNLFTNAVKYSVKPGEIAVRLKEREGGGLITVENRGPAVAAADLEQLFLPFFRLDQARSPAVQGSGLGLAIARRIVELHGGRIWAESAGGLVRFCVWLPVQGDSGKA
jgi:signal transduction histidine kinase